MHGLQNRVDDMVYNKVVLAWFISRLLVAWFISRSLAWFGVYWHGLLYFGMVIVCWHGLNNKVCC